MIRVLFRFAGVFFAVLVGHLTTSTASANESFAVLKPKSKNIVAIGRVPPKRKVVLQLGALRTDEASLPARKKSLKERMELRRKRALQRQRNVTNASRDRSRQQVQRQTVGKPNQGGGNSGFDDEFDNQDEEDVFDQPLNDGGDNTAQVDRGSNPLGGQDLNDLKAQAPGNNGGGENLGFDSFDGGAAPTAQDYFE